MKMQERGSVDLGYYCRLKKGHCSSAVINGDQAQASCTAKHCPLWEMKQYEILKANCRGDDPA